MGLARSVLSRRNWQSTNWGSSNCVLRTGTRQLTLTTGNPSPVRPYAREPVTPHPHLCAHLSPRLPGTRIHVHHPHPRPHPVPARLYRSHPTHILLSHSSSSLSLPHQNKQSQWSSTSPYVHCCTSVMTQPRTHDLGDEASHRDRLPRLPRCPAPRPQSSMPGMNHDARALQLHIVISS